MGRERGHSQESLREHLHRRFDRAEEIVDFSAPDNELLPDDPPAKLIDTSKETFSEAREAFPDLHVTVEDLVTEGDRVAARVTMRGTHQGSSRV
jgi:hypothetical protein